MASPAKKSPAPTKGAAPNKQGLPTPPAKPVANKPPAAPKDDKHTQLSTNVNYEADSGGGLSHTDADSFALPFLAILQSNSPQVTRGEAAYIKGAKAGDLFLTANALVLPFDEEDEDAPICHVVFANFKRRFLCWAPRDSGGGFKGEFGVDRIEAMRAEGSISEQDGKLYDAEGNIYRDTRIHYVIVITADGERFPAVISLASTQVKKSKSLLTQLNSYLFEGAQGRKFNPPTFAHVFAVKTVPESNDQGNWHGWSFAKSHNVDDAELYEMAKQFYKTTDAGLANVDYSRAEATNASGGGGEGSRW